MTGNLERGEPGFTESVHDVVECFAVVVRYGRWVRDRVQVG
jgi:hypothetical protein